MIVLRLAAALFLVQAGFHGYTAALPLALARAGVPDASIGLIVGVAALVQVPAAIAGGRLVDAFGGIRLLVGGAAAYLVATALLLLPGVEAGGSALPFVGARALQGIGIACTLPAALSLVPRIVGPSRQSSGLAFVGAAHNLTLVLLPPVSIAVLDAFTLDGVAWMVLCLIGAGLALTWRLPVRARADAGGAGATARDGAPALAQGVAGSRASRRYGITFRAAWAMPLLVVTCYVAHWGAVTAYLPVRAAAAGVDIGLFFAADGVAIFLMRLPTGWLADRISTRTLVATGAAATAVAISMLLLPLTTPMLVVSGLIGGAGGAVVMTPLLVELAHRSTDADRGSAFALYSGALAVAMTAGSIGGAPVVALFGLSAALAGGIALILVAIALALADPSFRASRHAGPADAEPPGHEHADAESVATAR